MSSNSTESRKAQNNPAEINEGKTICFCFEVNDTTIKKIIREHRIQEIDQVTELCNAGGGCSTCHPDIEDLIDQFWDEKELST